MDCRTTIDPIRPILRWAGSKRSQVRGLLDSLPVAYRRYMEPFAGSACLFFAATPSTAVLADRNEEVMEVYQALKCDLRGLISGLAALPQDDSQYYSVRAQRRDQLSLAERAARFIYLNTFCFNGVYRTNRRNEFNVPRGTRTGSLPSEARVRSCAYVLQNATLRTGDFTSTCADAREGDFVYLDPPYSDRADTEYGMYGYGLGHREYDAVVGAVGFERRSAWAPVAAARMTRSDRWAAAFADRRVLAFDQNRAELVKHGYQVDDVGDGFSEWLKRGPLQRVRAKEPPARLAIDVSSMSRTWIAETVAALIDSKRHIEVDFLYSPARYVAPPRTLSPPEFAGPVTARYAGWSVDPSLPVAAVVGLGYETGRGIGVLEFLEASAIWVYSPFGEDSRYDRAVVRANKPLAPLLSSTRGRQYDIAAPAQLVTDLEALIYSIKAEHRPVIVPFGPKIFALAAALVALMHEPNVALWRISAGSRAAGVNRRPSGRIVRLEVVFGTADVRGR